MSTNTLDFSVCFTQAWETYKKNALLLIGSSFVASVLISATAGILAGPILAGLMILMIKLIDGDSSAKFEDIFSQFDTFKTTFLLCLIWGIAAYILMLIFILIPILGIIASLFVYFVSSVFLLFAIILAAEQKLDFKEASNRSFHIIKANLWPLLGYTAVAFVLSGIGALACVIGIFITLPILHLMMACAYKSCSTEAVQEMIDIPMNDTPEAPAAAPEPPVEKAKPKPKRKPKAKAEPKAEQKPEPKVEPKTEPKEEEEEEEYIDLTEPELEL